MGDVVAEGWADLGGQEEAGASVGVRGAWEGQAFCCCCCCWLRPGWGCPGDPQRENVL